MLARSVCKAHCSFIQAHICIALQYCNMSDLLWIEKQIVECFGCSQHSDQQQECIKSFCLHGMICRLVLDFITTWPSRLCYAPEWSGSIMQSCFMHKRTAEKKNSGVSLQSCLLCRMVPRPLGILAGTVPCAECGGNPKVHLVSANLENVLNLALPWDCKVSFC